MRRSTKNTVLAIVAFVLVIAIVIACGIGSSWFTNSDIATWFNSWGKGEQPEQFGVFTYFPDLRTEPV